MFLTFSNTLLLVGLAGAVVPLVLHLLSRARYQTVEWGAMLFLEGLDGRPQHRAKLGQFLLLAARMSVVGLLAVALAEPVLQHWSPEPDATGAALRAAARGGLLSIGGAVGCGAAAVGLLMLGMTSIKEWGLRWWHASFALGAIAAASGVVWTVRRAAHWQSEVHRFQVLQAEQPPGERGGGALQSRIEAAILLDCSPSMDFEENGHTRFAVAQAAAKQVLAGLHRGDRVMLILLGQRQSDAELEPTADLQSIADRIDAAHTGHDTADVASALLQAQKMFDRAGHFARDIYVVGDRQALSWRGVDDYFLKTRWPQVLRHSGVPTRIFAVPVGSQDADNVAVEGIEPAAAPVILGQPAQLLIDVRNYGPTPRAALPLTITVNGRSVYDTTINLPPARSIRVAASINANALSTAGPQVIAAEVKSSGYTDDDRYESIVDVINPIRVLVVSGDEWQGTDTSFRSESDFLKIALSPFRSVRRAGADPCTVEVRSADTWDASDLQQYQVLVLANVERLSDVQARAIEQYVYGGGGVFIAPGSLSRVENYNDQLWREGSGVLPAQLEDATSADGADATAIVGYDPATPVFQFLHDRPDLMLSPTIGRYFPADATTADAKVLAWYTSGSPFLIETHAGKGRLLLMTTSLDADWSTLPLSNFYLPFVQSAVRYLATGTLPSHNLGVGDPINLTFDMPVGDSGVMELPDGDQQPINVMRFAGTAEAHFAGTREPGTYRLRINGPQGEQTLAFAVHGSHDESDLTPLSEQQWKDLEDGLRLRRIDPNERLVATSVASDRDGMDLAPWAITLVLLLAGAELALARHWSKDAF